MTTQPAGPTRTKSPERLWRILERVIREGIVFLGPDGQVEYTNTPARELLSHDPDELQRQVRALLEAIEGDPPHRIEVETASGSRALLVEPGPIDDEDCTGLVLVLKDARAVDALEEDIFLANRMRGLGELYMSLAHDLKTPINAMTLNLDALREAILEGAARSSSTELVDSVRHELTRVHRSIQAFLSQASPPRSDRRRFDVRRVFRETARLARPLAEGRDVELRLDLGREPVVVAGYRDRLKQAFLNIVVNGIEATPAGGTVTVKVSRDDRWVVATTRDEGPGIPEELRKTVFRMHFTTKEKGSGVGLFVARSTVLAHGGSVRVGDGPAGGASIDVRLPTNVAETVGA